MEPHESARTAGAVDHLQRSIGRHAAQRIAGAALDEAERLGISVNAAVVDRAGTLMAFLRMPDASLHAMETAMDKAYTAASFRFPTARWADALAGFPPVVQQNILQRPRLVVFGGGIPIEVDGQVIGAIGVSGGSVEQDERCAEAGMAALRPPPEGRRPAQRADIGNSGDTA
ncbi:GlcG/HbpS family heme-binding protein [Thauera sinica]|uniref:Heme-binding protein n=1 Tax=Thauera sinica TaxID=2665146 RepID=A0ABW1AUC4_9RHOO|nr:heme-binding protein [Thauera sp. K11]ATE62057.1 cobalamin adenosyltransferase [Thauera sp. K11]